MSYSDDPAEVFCVAEYIADELDARGWTTRDMASRMSDRNSWAMNVLMLDLLLACPNEENLLISDEQFADMALALDVSIDYLKRLHEVWRKWPDRRSPFECPEHLFS